MQRNTVRLLVLNLPWPRFAKYPHDEWLRQFTARRPFEHLLGQVSQDFNWTIECISHSIPASPTEVKELLCHDYQLMPGIVMWSP
jgi:hypothetical protein